MANDPHRASQVASRSYSSCRARHDTGIRATPAAKSRRRAIAPPNISCWSWHSLIPSPHGVHPGTVCGGQPPHGGGSGICEPRAWGLVSWELVAQLRGRRSSPTLALSPSIPRPPNRVRGRGMKRPRARETGERENLEGGRLGTPAASSSPWQSSPKLLRAGG